MCEHFANAIKLKRQRSVPTTTANKMMLQETAEIMSNRHKLSPVKIQVQVTKSTKHIPLKDSVSDAHTFRRIPNFCTFVQKLGIPLKYTNV